MNKVREKNREFFLKMIGPYCRRCGYSECSSALQFHHIDASQKLHINDSPARWMSLSRYNLIMKIVNTKFTILCSNCHVNLHTSLRQEEIDNIKPIDTNIFSEILKCMRRPKKIIMNEYAIAKNEDVTNITKMADFFSKLENIKTTREKRMEMGIDCEMSECGFCGIEDIITRPGGENE